MKPVMTIQELHKEGYPIKLLRMLARSEDASEYSFTTTKGKTATRYFWVTKLDKYIERRQEEWRY